MRLQIQRLLRDILVITASMSFIVADAQDRTLRYDCLVGSNMPTRGAETNAISYTDKNWDAVRIYRQLVVLITFSDCDFSQEKTTEFYDSLFNIQGYNPLDGSGCVADYFREQSNGCFNLRFDVFGPIKVSSTVKSEYPKYFGQHLFREAAQIMVDQNPETDFSVYDWNSDGTIEQVVFIYAGYAGNQPGLTGYIWPHTTEFSPVVTSDGYTIQKYSASAELWSNDTSCGIGTICHEYAHTLGLPDIYPTSTSVSDISIVDEWDLMDGGTATNRGWCPPNFSPLEKMLLGWLVPEELMSDTVITALKPVADGGKAFMIRQADNEFYLVENRQWNGWDYGLPGRGLVIYHVDYDELRWLSNTVNNVQDDPRYSIVAADGMTYTDWLNRIISSGRGNPYVDSARRLHSMIMSTAPYPWESVADCPLDDKSITDIKQHTDGTVSFTYHAGKHSAIRETCWEKAGNRKGIYDLSGRMISRDASGLSSLPSGIYIVNGRKLVVK